MVEAAQKRLEIALKRSDPLEIGWAHLDLAFALYQNSADQQQFLKNCKLALIEADKAIDSFSSVPFPAGIASAHLARASIYTQLIDPKHDEVKKAAEVDRALTACLAAQVAVDAEGVTAGQIFDIYSSTSVLLLLLRGTLENEEFQTQLDDLINKTSILLGEIVAEDVKLRVEGSSLLLGSDLMGALAEIEEDQEEQKDILKTQSMLALQAARWFESSSDPDLMNGAVEKYQAALSRLDGKEGTEKCPGCGKINSPGAKFCDQCGTPLKDKK